MNLKTAASRLGVHYQTVYRWVRAGELPAVRVGLGYEVTEEGLAYFAARRRVPGAALTPSAAPPAGAGPAPEQYRDVVPSDSDSLLAAVTTLRRAASSTLTPLVTTLAQGAASVLDAGTDVRLVAPDDPRRVVSVASWHPSIEHRGSWAQLSEAAGPATVDDPIVQRALHGGVHVVDHQRPATVRAQVPAEWSYLLDGIYPHTSMFAVVRGADGAPLGLVSAARGEAGRLFTLPERALVAGLADQLAAAVATQRAFGAAWRLRRALVRRIGRVAATRSDAATVRRAAGELVSRTSGSALLLDGTATIVAASTGFHRLFGADGRRSGSPLSTIIRPEDREGDLASFQRLWRGDLDHLTVARRRAGASGPLDLDVHWSMVRRDDGRPVFVVATHSPRIDVPAPASA